MGDSYPPLVVFGTPGDAAESVFLIERVLDFESLRLELRDPRFGRPHRSQMDSYRCVIEGRVQGVGFRYFVLRQAQRFGVVGWVRNLDDGSVELQAEGEADSMRTFLEMVRSGPGFSYVTNVSVEEVPAEGFTGFSIVR